MVNNQNIPVRTESVGLGDKNFTAWTVHIDAQGNRTHVEIPFGWRSGSNVYRVDTKLNEIIDALKKEDQGKDPVWPGRSADIVRRFDRSITAQANHSNPRLDTRTIEGTNAALSQLHESTLRRNLFVPYWDHPGTVRGGIVGVADHKYESSSISPTTRSILGGRLASFAAGVVAVAGSLLSNDASAQDLSKTARQTVDAVVPGANLNGQKSLCQAWGEVAGVTAGVVAGVVVSPAVTPAGGVATAIFVDEAASRLTNQVCGPS